MAQVNREEQQQAGDGAAIAGKGIADRCAVVGGFADSRRAEVGEPAGDRLGGRDRTEGG